MVADCEDASHEVQLVTGWIDGQPALRAILAEAEQVEPGLGQDALVTALQNGGSGLGRQFGWPSRTEGGRAFVIWHLMRRIAADDEGATPGAQIVLNYAHAVSSHSNLNDMWREFAERVLRPFFDYLGERVGAESSVLYILERDVRRME
jgi:hypothetical protein